MPTCPWAFTKLTRTLLQRWRRLGIKCLGYIDDFLFAAPSRQALEHLLQNTVLPDLRAAGMVVSIEKCHLTPLQQQPFLGVVIDTRGEGTMRIAEEKLVHTREAIDSLLLAHAHRQPVSVRSLAKLAGKITSMRWAFGMLVPLFTRGLHSCIGNHDMWEHVPLGDNAVRDLLFWQSGLARFNGFSRLWRPMQTRWVIHTDAAGIGSDGFQGGWGGLLSQPWSRRPVSSAHGTFQAFTSLHNSTFQELEAVYCNLLTFNREGALGGHCVRIVSDSQAAVAIMAAFRSRNPDLHAQCSKIFMYCMQHDIRLLADWVPREENAEADALSKWHDRGDWCFNPSLFMEIANQFGIGPQDVDLFASEDNTLLARFYSYRPSPHCEGVDGLAAAPLWHSFRAWAFPPYQLIGQLLALLQRHAAYMCLIVPWLPGAVWWPVLAPSGSHFAAWVHEARLLLPRDHPLLVRPGPSNRPHATTPNWPMLALRVDTRQPCQPLVPAPQS